MAAVVTTTSITLSSNRIQNGDILVPANPGSPGKWRLKRRDLWYKWQKFSRPFYEMYNLLCKNCEHCTVCATRRPQTLAKSAYSCSPSHSGENLCKKIPPVSNGLLLVRHPARQQNFIRNYQQPLELSAKFVQFFPRWKWWKWLWKFSNPYCDPGHLQNLITCC